MTTATTYALYLVFALGGAGVYFMLPRTGRSRVLSGAVIASLAVFALLAVLAFGIIDSASGSGYFYLFAVIALLGAGRVITHPKPTYSALYFVLVVVAVAALLVLQGAEFLAVALVLIYAGAILITYAFVIMLAQQSGSPIYDRQSREPFIAVFAGFVLMAAIAGRAGELPVAGASADAARIAPIAMVAQTNARANQQDDSDREGADESNSLKMGVIIMVNYVVVVQIAGVLLLIAMIGAIALSRKKVPYDGPRAADVPLGEIGRKVKPY